MCFTRLPNVTAVNLAQCISGLGVFEAWWSVRVPNNLQFFQKQMICDIQISHSHHCFFEMICRYRSSLHSLLELILWKYNLCSEKLSRRCSKQRKRSGAPCLVSVPCIRDWTEPGPDCLDKSSHNLISGDLSVNARKDLSRASRGKWSATNSKIWQIFAGCGSPFEMNKKEPLRLARTLWCETQNRWKCLTNREQREREREDANRNATIETVH